VLILHDLKLLRRARRWACRRDQCGTICAQRLVPKIVTHIRAAALTASIAIAALAAANVCAVPRSVCLDSPTAQPAVARLREALAHGRFVTYQPTSLKVVNGRVTPADPAGIRADLTVLRRNFDGLITYEALHGAGSIPALAASLKFRALIIGVWNPLDEAELGAAIEAARNFPELVAGISLGNEMLFSRRIDAGSLAAVLARVRARLPGMALSSSEPFHIYSQPAASGLLAQLDFLLPNVHPVFQPWFRDAPDSNAAQFVVNVLAELAPLACGPILVKETGVPTAPVSAGFSEERQAAFYRELRRRLPPAAQRGFAYFAAFDAPWRAYDATGVPGAAPAVHPEEAHWGLYDAERQPKLAARDLPPLSARK
jgi:exo-beta-1,3-glucanase (GH17 family)